jgi:hypothetical protein
MFCVGNNWICWERIDGNGRQPMLKDKCKKVVVEILLKGLWEPHGTPVIR